jgi:hypothetical protein
VEGVKNNGRCCILVGKEYSFRLLKVPRQYRIVLVVKISWRKGKALETNFSL